MSKKLWMWIFIALFFIALNFGFFDMNGHSNIVTLVGFAVMMISAFGAIMMLDNNTAEH